MNTHLQYAGAIYALYVAVFFFLKKKTKSLENKIYGGMIVHTVLMFIFNIGSRIVPTKFPLTFPPVFILTKIKRRRVWKKEKETEHQVHRKDKKV